MAKDCNGTEIEVGNVVARAVYKSVTIAIVTKKAGGKVFLNNSKVPINYPNRLLVLPDSYGKGKL